MRIPLITGACACLTRRVHAERRERGHAVAVGMTPAGPDVVAAVDRHAPRAGRGPRAEDGRPARGVAGSGRARSRAPGPSAAGGRPPRTGRSTRASRSFGPGRGGTRGPCGPRRRSPRPRPPGAACTGVSRPRGPSAMPVRTARPGTAPRRVAGTPVRLLPRSRLRPSGDPRGGRSGALRRTARPRGPTGCSWGKDPQEITRPAQRRAGSSGARPWLVAEKAGSGLREAVTPLAAVRERDRAHTRRISLDPGAPYHAPRRASVRKQPSPAPPAVPSGGADA